MIRHPCVYALVLLLLFPALALACTFFWEAVTLNQDGSPLTDLALYRLYHSTTTPAVWTPVGDVAGTVTAVTLAVCPRGEYVVRAINTVGVESENSNVWPIKQPGKPTITRVSK